MFSGELPHSTEEGAPYDWLLPEHSLPEGSGTAPQGTESHQNTSSRSSRTKTSSARARGTSTSQTNPSTGGAEGTHNNVEEDEESRYLQNVPPPMVTRYIDTVCG